MLMKYIILLLPSVLALPWMELQAAQKDSGLHFVSAELEPFEQTWASFKIAHGKFVTSLT